MSDRTKLILASGLIAVSLMLLLRWAFAGDGASGLARSDNPDDRLDAVELLRQRDADDSSALLTKLANDSDERVAVQALRAMGHSRRPEHVSTLTQMLEKSRPSKVRAAAAASLGRYEETQSATLLAMLRNEPDATVRAGVTQGLAQRAELAETVDKESLAKLYQLLRDPDPSVRVWAITGISRMTRHRYAFDASKPPETQEQVLRELGEYLKMQTFK